MSVLISDFYDPSQMTAAMFVCGSSPGSNAQLVIRYGSATAIDLYPMQAAA